MLKIKPIVIAVSACVLLSVIWINKTLILFALLGWAEGEPPLIDKPDEPEQVQWFDDYYTIEYITENTIAIGEPRYWQANYNYLIIGDKKAILFDSGPGVRDIKPVVESLTDLPVTVVASHLHYDHVGNHNNFQTVAMLDVPYIRDNAKNNIVKSYFHQHLGFMEGIQNPAINVSEWWQPGQMIDIGNRLLKVVSAPGHTPGSLMLWDEANNVLFTGDYIYDGELYVMLPGADLAAYEKTAKQLIAMVNESTRLLTAHRTTAIAAPVLIKNDLADLLAALKKIKNGELKAQGWLTKTYPVNERLWLVTD